MWRKEAKSVKSINKSTNTVLYGGNDSVKYTSNLVLLVQVALKCSRNIVLPLPVAQTCMHINKQSIWPESVTLYISELGAVHQMWFWYWCSYLDGGALNVKHRHPCHSSCFLSSYCSLCYSWMGQLTMLPPHQWILWITRWIEHYKAQRMELNKKKIAAIITDNVHDILVTLPYMSLPKHACTAHTLHVTVSKDLQVENWLENVNSWPVTLNTDSQEAKSLKNWHAT